MAYPYAPTQNFTTTTVKVPTVQQPKQLPLWQTGQNVPLMQQQPIQQPLANQVQQQPQAPAQSNLNDQVLQTAQQKAIAGNNNGTMDLVTQQTNKLLKDPNMGINYDQYKNNQLEQQNRNLNQQLETVRQQTAPLSYTGQNLRDLTNVAMNAVQQRADTSRQIDYDTQTKQRENMLAALAQGQSVAQQQQSNLAQDINNLVNVRNSAEGAENRSADIQKLNLTFGQDMTKLITQNDWQGAQNQLNRNLELAKQSNDIASQEKLAQQQIELDKYKLDATQDWQGVQNDLNRQLELAKQSNDINAQSDIVNRQIALDKWKQQNGQEFTAAQNALNRSLELTLKDKDTQAQSTLLELKSKLDMGQLLKQQDFEATQNELQRKIEDSWKKGDWSNTLELTKLKGEIDKQAQAAQQEWQTGERVASEGWQTSERISAQDAAIGMKYIDAEINKAAQAQDFENQKYLEAQKRNLQLKMQTDSMNHDEKMAYLNSQLQEAKANGDVDRQKNILTFQHAQEMDTLDRTQGFQAAMQYAQQQADMAIKQGDWTNAQVLQQQQIAYQAQKDAADQTIEQAKLALEGKQIDLQGRQLTFEQIEQGVQNGQIDPQAATDAIATAAKQYGITVQAADPLATQKAALQQYKDMQYQFGLSHPDMVQNDGSLKPEGIKAFNSYINKATATQADPATVTADIIQNPTNYIGAAKGGENQAEYQALLNKSAIFTSTESNLDHGTYKFVNSTPTINTSFKDGAGNLYVSTSGIQVEKRDGAPDKQFFTAIDVNTGKTIRIYPGTFNPQPEKTNAAATIWDMFSKVPEMVNSVNKG